MSKRQKDTCAARMPPDKAVEFLDLLSASDALFVSSVRLRRRAWDLYRESTPTTAPRAPQLVAPRPPAGARG